MILRALRTFPFCAQNSLPPLPVVSMKNTISVSSIHDDSIILTLFRELKGVFGQKLEMQEYLYENIPPVQDVYTAMLACALILLTTPEET